jgi:hypothetical protein
MWSPKELPPAIRRHRVDPAQVTATLRRLPWELVGYCVVAVVLGLLLWEQVRHVNAFYLDEWVYVGAAETIWRHLPGGVIESIPGWNRSVQRAYSTLLAPFVGLSGRSTAFTAGHVLNVLLLSVATVPPVVLFARRAIAAPVLRVLAVGLAVVLPWTMISAHLLTESLAYPVFLWCSLAIIRAAEDPTLGRQAVALGAIVGLVMCRLNLGAMAGTLVVVSLGGELLRPRHERPLRVVLRRQAPILALLVILVIGAIYLLGPGASRLGAYGGLDLPGVRSRLFGSRAGEARGTAEAYTRSLALGTLLLPFALGLATALAAAAGRLGRSVGLLSLLALASLVSVIGAVTLATTGVALEERYVFYPVAALAVLACAGIERARTLWPWAVVSGVFVGWIVASGPPFPARDSGNFFAAPAGAFWTRVMDYRLRVWEQDLFGWTGLAARGWLLVAVALAVLVIALMLARRLLRPVQLILAAAAALCLVGQAIVLHYSLGQELYGTVDVPSGIATGARETFVDATLPNAARAAVVPGLLVGEPGGGAERITFWNAKVINTVSLRWDGTPAPAPPGVGVMASVVGPGGLAELRGRLEPFLAADVDDPRVQFATRLVIRSPDSRYALFAEPHRRALWTAQGLEPDTAALPGRLVRLTVDRSAGVRSARVTLQGPTGQQEPVAWRITTAGRPVASGRLADGVTRQVVLRAPACRLSACRPWSWQLLAKGPGVPASIPVYGAPLPPRPVALWMPAVRLELSR